MQKDRALKFVVLLSLVSLCADIVYEGARSVTGPFLAELGASALVVGAVAGFGDMLGYALRLLSGKAADKTRAYWTITIVGYVINLLAVPALAFAGNWQVAALLIVAERTGKAIRSPARDVMLSAAGSQLGSGFAFGLHQALDQVGAVAGPLIISYVMFSQHNARLGFMVLAAPAAVALILLCAARFLFPHPDELRVEAPGIQSAGLTSAFWLHIAAVSLVAAGTMDYPLIAFHFKATAMLPEALIPAFYSVAMAADAMAALILGKVFDKAGMIVLAAVSALTSLVAPILFFSSSTLSALAAVSIWGVGLGTQGSIMRAVIAQLVPSEQRGSAYGLFGLCYGLSWFAGSLLIGALYKHFQLALVIFSTAAQLLAVPLFLLVQRKRAA